MDTNDTTMSLCDGWDDGQEGRMEWGWDIVEIGWHILLVLLIIFGMDA